MNFMDFFQRLILSKVKFKGLEAISGKLMALIMC